MAHSAAGAAAHSLGRYVHAVVVFRDPKLAPDQQIDVARRFGKLEIHLSKEVRLPGDDEILMVSNLLDGNSKAIAAQEAQAWGAHVVQEHAPTEEQLRSVPDARDYSSTKRAPPASQDYTRQRRTNCVPSIEPRSITICRCGG
ncbi:MAG: hypothetical protein ABL891_18240 [Burkholderiales bacterium]